jgi:CDP-4-dehydro-6-deoxyglucose reductase
MSETYTITLLPMGETLPCATGETVLRAILRSGARVFFGCTGGGCGVCKMRLSSGLLDHGRCSAAALSEEEKRQGFFLSCQARPRSDLTIRVTETNRYRKAATFFQWSLIFQQPGEGDAHERGEEGSGQTADDRR